MFFPRHEAGPLDFEHNPSHYGDRRTVLQYASKSEDLAEEHYRRGKADRIMSDERVSKFC